MGTLVAKAERDYREGMRYVARIVEMLREGGYDCELASETRH